MWMAIRWTNLHLPNQMDYISGCLDVQSLEIVLFQKSWLLNLKDPLTSVWMANMKCHKMLRFVRY